MSRVTNRPTPVTVVFCDGGLQEMEWPHNLCTIEAVTGRVTPPGNLKVRLRRIESDGTFIYDEVPGSFTPLPLTRRSSDETSHP